MSTPPTHDHHEHPHPHDHDHEPDHEHGHDHDHEHPKGLWGALKHALVPHSHDHADRTDGALERSAEGIKAVKISLIGLGVTAVLQLVIVWLSSSTALLADTIHNFSDALTAVPLWIAFVLGRRAPTRRLTHGYGRAEDVAGLFIVAMIALSAVLAAWHGIDRLIHPEPMTHLAWVAAAGVIGFLGNEAVALYRIHVGRRIGSAALTADGYHARADGLTSLAVVLGVIGTKLGFPQADPIIGLLIAGAIVMVLWGAARDVLRRLMDAVEPHLVDEIESIAAGTGGVTAVRNVRARWVGHSVVAEVDLATDAASLPDAQAVAAHVEEHVREHVRDAHTVRVRLVA